MYSDSRFLCCIIKLNMKGNCFETASVVSFFFIGKTAFVSAACAETAIKHPRRTVAHKSLKFDLQGIVVAEMHDKRMSK